MQCSMNSIGGPSQGYRARPLTPKARAPQAKPPQALTDVSARSLTKPSFVTAAQSEVSARLASPYLILGLEA